MAHLLQALGLQPGATSSTHTSVAMTQKEIEEIEKTSGSQVAGHPGIVRVDTPEDEKKNNTKKPPLIQSPPELPKALQHAATEQLEHEKEKQQMEKHLQSSETPLEHEPEEPNQDKQRPDEIEVNIEEQRRLKKQKDDEAKELAKTKKEEAARKKEEAAAKALAIAERKLQRAQAKAEAIRSKQAGSTKRKLEPELEKVKDAKENTAISPVKPKAKASRRKKTTPNTKQLGVKLSPKAKAFALSNSSPSKGSGTDKRAGVAASSLKMLRELNLPNLELPSENFSRKKLECIIRCKKAR